MFEIPGRQVHSYILESGNDGGAAVDEKAQSRSYAAKTSRERDQQQIGWALDRSNEKAPVSRLTNDATGPRAVTPQSKGQSGDHQT